MDKLKLVFWILVALLLFAGAGRGVYELFAELGFGKTALLLLAVEFFFIARGSYLAAGAAKIYVEELRVLRAAMEDSGNREAARRGFAASDMKFYRGSAARRILGTAIVLVLSGTVYIFYGYIASAAVIILGVLALGVKLVYALRKSFVDAQKELEDIRLTFLKNDNGLPGNNMTKI